jgi:multicomponent Na+:H+ antiporter subunit E
MPLLLFILWIILNGRVTVDVLAVGVLAVFLVSVFSNKYLGYSFKHDLFMLKKLHLVAKYFFMLIKDMIICSIQVAIIVLSPNMKEKVSPCIINFKSPIKSHIGRTVMANTITAIPGSVTGELTDEGFSVHALTVEIAHAQHDSAFEKCILDIES